MADHRHPPVAYSLRRDIAVLSFGEATPEYELYASGYCLDRPSIAPSGATGRGKIDGRPHDRLWFTDRLAF